MRNLLLILLIGIGSCKEAKEERNALVPEEKEAIAKVVLTDLDNQSIDLKNYEGKTIFLNFWATWCKPCIFEMPSMKRVQDSLSKNGIVFLLASNESSDEIREFEKNYNYNFNYTKVVNLEELGVQGLPTTYIISPEGKLVFSETGYRKWDDSINIEMLLKINNQK